MWPINALKNALCHIFSSINLCNFLILLFRPLWQKKKKNTENNSMQKQFFAHSHQILFAHNILMIIERIGDNPSNRGWFPI